MKNGRGKFRKCPKIIVCFQGFLDKFSHFFQATDDIDSVEQYLPQALKLLSDMNESAQQVHGLVDTMLMQVRSGELSTENGLSFLEVKYHTLLDYLINLTFFMLKKCSGNQQATIDDPCIFRLIELRTILEKIRPIDYKLRYRIDKLVKTATTGVKDTNDPSNYKARPDQLVSQLQDEEDEGTSEGESDEEDTTSPKSGVKPVENKLYRPPKLTAMPYEDDDVVDKRKKQFERARQRALGSSIIREMKEEFLDTPIEITDGSRAQQMYSKAQKEREQYEEDNFVRLPITKADKHRQKRLTTLGKFGFKSKILLSKNYFISGTLGDEITSFRDISALTGSYKAKEGGKGKGKKRKLAGGKKKGGGKKRKLH